MRILAVGGSGEIGENAIRTLLSYDFIKKITIADINKERADFLSDKFGPLVYSLKLDLSDSQSLESSLKEVDVVMNTAGPYYRFGCLVLNACIENGCDYFDVNDDWEPIRDFQIYLHQKLSPA